MQSRVHLGVWNGLSNYQQLERIVQTRTLAGLELPTSHASHPGPEHPDLGAGIRTLNVQKNDLPTISVKPMKESYWLYI